MLKLFENFEIVLYFILNFQKNIGNLKFKIQKNKYKHYFFVYATFFNNIIVFLIYENSF
jgi:hypothetical protein